MRELGSLESEVMSTVWAAGAPRTVREVLDLLLERREVAYTTVLTVMEKLHRKGLLSRVQDGRAHRYRAEISREAYTAGLMETALAASEDRAGALLHFVETMPTDDVEVLREALREVRRARDEERGS